MTGCNMCTVYHCSAGERMDDPEVDKILKFTDTQEDFEGNIKYEGECRKHIYAS